MSNEDPCKCQERPCHCHRPCTKCDRDTKNNVWLERGTPGAIGICLLDTASETQVIYILERDERARKDLRRVTSDPRLLELADTIDRLPTMELSDAVQADANREGPGTNVLYSVFRGVPPFVGMPTR